MSDGDYYQASHWRQGSVDGIMQPAISSGTTFYPNFYREADIEMFDAIGWDYHIIPGNDDCADAIAVGNGTYSDSTQYATNDGSATCGSSSSSPDVWYTFDTGPSGTLDVDTCGSSYNTVVSIYTGTCGSLTEVACNDNSDDCGVGSSQSSISLPITSPTTYTIRVSGASGASGEYTLNISGALPDTAPPTNFQWIQTPVEVTSTSLGMEVYAEETYSPPVEYRYQALSSGATTREWNTDPTYIDTELGKNTIYAYRAYARDSAEPTPNVTSYISGTGATGIETPSEITFGEITTNSIVVNTAHYEDGGGPFTYLTSASSGIYFEVRDMEDNLTGSGDANTWVQTDSITVTGLTPGTTYKIRVKARNRLAYETEWYPTPTPDPEFVEQATAGGSLCTYSMGDINGDLEVNGDDIRCMVECAINGSAAGCDCACGDMYPPPNGGDGFDMDDVAEFVDAVLAG
jgi:hypothetical protein